MASLDARPLKLDPTLLATGNSLKILQETRAVRITVVRNSGDVSSPEHANDFSRKTMRD